MAQKLIGISFILMLIMVLFESQAKQRSLQLTNVIARYVMAMAEEGKKHAPTNVLQKGGQ